MWFLKPSPTYTHKEDVKLPLSKDFDEKAQHKQHKKYQTEP